MGSMRGPVNWDITTGVPVSVPCANWEMVVISQMVDEALITSVPGKDVGG